MLFVEAVVVATVTVADDDDYGSIMMTMTTL